MKRSSSLRRMLSPMLPLSGVSTAMAQLLAAAVAASGVAAAVFIWTAALLTRSEEHTSELQSQSNLVCRLPLEKKNNRHGRHGHSDPRQSALDGTPSEA